MHMPEVNTKPVMPSNAIVNPQAYGLSNMGPMAEQVSVGSILGQLPANPPSSSGQHMHGNGLKSSNSSSGT